MNTSSLVTVPKAAEFVARELRKEIIRGTLKKGDKLATEAQLMIRFGVSRPTLREAIRVLESEGLLRTSRGIRGGALVLSPNINVAARYVGFVLQAGGTTLADIYRVHALVEPSIARIVAEKAAKTAPAILRGEVAKCVGHIDDNFEFGIASARFSSVLIELANVPTMTLLLGMLNHIFEQASGRLLSGSAVQIGNGPAKRLVIRSYEILIKLIEEGDGVGAEAHWQRHTAAVEKKMSRSVLATRILDILDE